MTRAKLIWLLIGTFLLGAFAGMWGTAAFVRRQAAAIYRGEAPALRRTALHHLTRTLDLTPEQQGQVSTVIEHAQVELAAVRAQMHPEIRRILRGAFEEIQQVLTPAQREQAEKMRLRFHKYWGEKDKADATTVENQQNSGH